MNLGFRLKIFWVLLFFTTCSQAEWVSLGITRNPDATNYLSTEKVQRKGSEVIFWGLVSYDIPTDKLIKNKYQSMMTLYSIKCSNKSYDALATYFYRGPMGSGQIVRQEDFRDSIEYSPIPAGGVVDKMRGYLCK